MWAALGRLNLFVMELTELEILSEKEDICGREDFFKLLFTWKKIAKTLEFFCINLKKIHLQKKVD